LLLPFSRVVHKLLFGALRARCRSSSLGVQISLYNFGSGFSSLIYVKDLPVDGLKVDKSFIDGLVEDTVNVAPPTRRARRGSG
jgi:sensor c-di-GMP phosphodiesterase-like protein